MTKEKILLITQYFPPDMAGTGRVMEELAENLSYYEYEITVLTGKSRYFNQRGYKEYCGKMPVKRIWYPHFNKDIEVGRILNFISFPIMILMRIFFIKRFDKIIIVSNPPTNVGIGALINKLFKKKIYYILQDLYPDLAVNLNIISEKSLLTRMMRWLNKWSFEYIEKIILLSESMNRYFRDHYCGLENKTVVISNWADPVKITPLSKDNSWSRLSGYYDKFVVLYAGNIGLFQNFNPILKAAKLLKEDKGIIFLFVGEGGDKNNLQKEVEKENLSNVDFMSYVPDEDYAKLLASAGCCIVTLKKGMENFCFPGKIYSYLAAGRPIIAISDKLSELAKLVLDNDMGFVVDNENGIELKNSIKNIKEDKNLFNRLCNNSRNVLLNKFTRSRIVKQYFDILQ
ncbi:MAG: Capsular polysaccharide synthesis enzyme Cap5L [Parcubacteria group bacterium GW2011_GWD2_38_12]|nr:MAG: Capsular polysaccharide synthesis enzyme Cap5L [Parcubacteria group bacterium GW2011_GWC2_36_17]KKQ52334.1 MAG: Capsular polysaccharide synthesis enzyme Cap5L [Parcubacteria group bacterium GW2011_GWD2_38_12]KKQ58618.1 MAG: Capsular polysaccharide synthesis enzyme Cap5L [Parcubacteria group bacterium GW2011_GWC1_38_17]KKQ58621.1 MAG: Capsular polysaccharide synthesis enzyme Cap5L [Parcubacteria group bacterium GW2011_GWD1_38_16]